MNKEDYPRTSKEALELGLRYYYSGNLCKHGHDALRYSRNRICVECTKTYRTRNNYPQTDAYKDYQREYQAAYRKTEKGLANIQRAQKKWRDKQ